MNKSIFIILIIIAVIIGALLFIFKLKGSVCGSYDEAECRANFACKPFYEYGLSCGEDGCREGERFKECTPRF